MVTVSGRLVGRGRHLTRRQFLVAGAGVFGASALSASRVRLNRPLG